MGYWSRSPVRREGLARDMCQGLWVRPVETHDPQFGFPPTGGGEDEVAPVRGPGGVFIVSRAEGQSLRRTGADVHRVDVEISLVLALGESDEVALRRPGGRIAFAV